MSSDHIDLDANNELSEQEQIRLDKLIELQDADKNPYEIRSCDISHKAEDIHSGFAELEDSTVSVAGRLMSKRGMGKVTFSDLQDSSGQIQIFTKIDALGEENYEEWKNLDIGDLVWVEGEVFRTNRGEISIRNKSWQLLSKSLRPLPEKFHGLRDTDIRYRKRYLDLIVNPDVRDTFIKRSQIIQSIRGELMDRGFLEVETPQLNTIAGGANARPFITHHNALDIDLYLRISPELYLKRLIVGGFDKVFEIGRNFRNEGMSTKHNPEFTMVELYQAYTDYHGMMEITEDLITKAAEKVCDSLKVNYQGQEIDLTPPYRRISMIDAVKEYAGIDFNSISNDEEAHKAMQEHNVPDVLEDMKRGDLLNHCFELYAEEKLIQPTFVVDYPLEVSPLTKKKPGHDGLVERFELFIGGREYANAYSELNDPIDQKERFADQMKKHLAGDVEAQLPDEDFVEALEYGMPPTGGLGIGIDRLVMLLTDQGSIRDVLLFPTMRPLEDQPSYIVDTSQDEVDENIEKIDLSKVKIEPLFEDMVDFNTFSKSDMRVVKVLNCEDNPKSRNLLKFTLDDGSDKERVILSGIKDFYKPEDLIGKTLLAICNLPPKKMMGIDSEGMLLSAVYDYDGEEKLNLIMLPSHLPAGAKIY